jgi:excisionase family DNA binding protein
VTRVAAKLPGYASVARASEVLHLAKRSVRDLIYAGRLPSTRVGRLHFIKTTDLETERRRRLGLPVPQYAPRTSHRPIVRLASATTHTDPALRRQRATERAELVRVWSQRHHPDETRVPGQVLTVTTPVTCDVCSRTMRSGRVVEMSAHDERAAATMCLTCARRALLDWADRRRQEAAAARRLSESLGHPIATPAAA